MAATLASGGRRQAAGRCSIPLQSLLAAAASPRPGHLPIRFNHCKTPFVAIVAVHGRARGASPADGSGCLLLWAHRPRDTSLNNVLEDKSL